MQSYRFVMSGKVQGVYYRKNVQANAKKENFSGYVKNLSDGSVEAAVTCDIAKLDIFLDILQQGSKSSIVENITKTEFDEEFTGEFEIRY